MPKAQLTKSQWLEVQTMIESGQMDYGQASEHYGVEKNAIQQRSHRFKWATPRRLAEAALVEQAKAAAKTMTVEEAMETVTKTPEGVLTKQAGKLARLREETPLFVADSLDKVIRAALTGGLPVPKTWKEFASACGIFSTMVGLKGSTAGPLVQIGMNWGGTTTKTQEGPVVVVQGERVG